jgi:hypothetical protein
MSYDSFVANDAASQKGGEPVERLTIERARRIVDDVLGRRDMPRKRKTDDEDEIDALVDDLDELDEDEEVEEEDVEEEEEEDVVEDEDEDDEDEEDEDPDEAPRKRSRSKSKTKTTKAKAVGVGTVEVAEAAGIEPRQLRMFLRAEGVQAGDSREGRYHWKSLNDPEVKRIIKAIRSGAVKKLNEEKLEGLKSKKTKKSTAKKTTKKRRTAKSSA